MTEELDEPAAPAAVSLLSPDESRENVTSHERSAVTEFVDTARTMLNDLRAERARRKKQDWETQNSSQGALNRASWCQDAAADVLRRVRTIQNLSQAVTDWNLCAEERVRLREAENSEKHISNQVNMLVEQQKIEMEVAWSRERSHLAEELAQVKSALWQQTVAGESMPRTPRAAGGASRLEDGQLDDRRLKLKEVFAAFDLDESGFIEVSELFELGKARRKSGQRKGQWTAEQNRKLVEKLDSNYDGKVSMQEFIEHFSESLPRGSDNFDLIIHDFFEVARLVRHQRAAILAMEESEAITEVENDGEEYEDEDAEEQQLLALEKAMERAVFSVPYIESVRPFMVAWRSKMKMEELMSPRSYAQKMGVLVKRERQYPTPRSARNTPRSVQYPTELCAVVGKCGNTITSRWGARFVTLDNRSMKIFEDSSRNKTKTSIPLHHLSSVKEHDKRAFAIKIKLSDGRSFFLGLQNEKMRQQWLGTINHYISMPTTPRTPTRSSVPASPRHMV